MVVAGNTASAIPAEGLMAAYLGFWGKARGGKPGEPGWHPLPYHCLDVAAVAQELLCAFPRQPARLAALLGTSVENLTALLVALIALHDIGKFGTGFQTKSPEHWPSVLGPKPLSGEGLCGDHAEFASRARKVLGLKAACADWIKDWGNQDFEALWHAVAGHHGKPRSVQPSKDVGRDLPPVALKAALAFRDDVLALFPGAAALAELPPGDRRLGVLTWYVAGLTVAADWIGSRRDWFRYVEPGPDVSGYWPLAQAKAKEAVALSGLLPCAFNPSSLAATFLPEGASPSPLQQLLAQTPLPTGPGLMIVEDVTGSGKTEAALVLATRLGAADQASGMFFALPTMATANAMYVRMMKVYRRVFAPDAKPSLVLAHGRRSLNDGFQGSITLGDMAVDGTGHRDEGAAVCAAWLADDRRKSLLAHAGVGTIDQALLGVLPSKYQSLRLWGLAGKVLIVDEVHCYDEYVGRELERLLEFHAALGGSAILLSATLPARQRGRLLAAFERGLGFAAAVDAPKPTPDAYPLVSMTSEQGRDFLEPQTRADRHRALGIRRLASIDEAVAAVISAARRGAAVAWVRNAVDDAIEAAEALQQAAPDLPVLLLHSRFAMGHRLDKEDAVRRHLGHGECSGRAGFILVGTQILEASLDYDVDLMVSDLAPVDLLIQRAGRIWRHSDRNTRPLEKAELLLLTPDPKAVMGPDWFKELSRRASYVYAHHGVVWRSASALLTEGKLATPSGVRPLIEAVYGRDRDDLDDVPEPLHAASRQALGKEGAARSFAQTNLLQVEYGYSGNQDIWKDDILTPTRLGDPVTVFRLVELRGGAIVPLCGNDTSMKSWALSEVSIARRKADGEVLPPDLANQVELARNGWPEWERQMPMLFLTRSGDHSWSGTVMRDGKRLGVFYSADTGLRVEP